MRSRWRIQKNGIPQGNVLSKRHCLQAVERSQTAVQIVLNFSAPDLPFFLGKPAMRTRWLAGAASQKRVMSKLIQVKQHPTNESGFMISAMNKYMLGSRYP